jgi:hypothetical protein
VLTHTRHEPTRTFATLPNLWLNASSCSTGSAARRTCQLDAAESAHTHTITRVRQRLHARTHTKHSRTTRGIYRDRHLLCHAVQVSRRAARRRQRHRHAECARDRHQQQPSSRALCARTQLSVSHTLHHIALTSVSTHCATRAATLRATAARSASTSLCVQRGITQSYYMILRTCAASRGGSSDAKCARSVGDVRS